MIASQQVNARVYADLKELLFGVIRALTAAIDAKDPYTSGHSERVARIAVRLAEELGMSPNQRGDLYLTGLLHDVGKIGVDDAVLEEARPADARGVPADPGARRDRRPHPRRPQEAQPPPARRPPPPREPRRHRLPRAASPATRSPGRPASWPSPTAYDAMSSTRPYRRRLTPSQIDEILRKGSGVQWDPKVIDALFACRMDLEMIRQKGLGESLQLAVSETLGRTWSAGNVTPSGATGPYPNP